MLTGAAALNNVLRGDKTVEELVSGGGQHVDPLILKPRWVLFMTEDDH